MANNGKSYIKNRVQKGEKDLNNERSHRQYQAKKNEEKNQSTFRKALSNPDSRLNISMTYVCIFFAVYLGFCLFTNSGEIFGHFTRFILFGLFSSVAYAIPFFLLLQGATWRYDIKSKALLRKAISSFIALIFVSAIVYLPSNILNNAEISNAGDFFRLFFNTEDPASAKNGGGLLGSALGWCLYKVFGKVGAILIISLAILVFLIFFFNFNPKTFVLNIYSFLKLRIQNIKGKKAARKLACSENRQEIAEVQIEPYIETSENEEQNGLVAHARKRSSAITHESEFPITTYSPTNSSENDSSRKEKFNDIFSELSAQGEEQKPKSSQTIKELVSDRSAFSQGEEDENAALGAKSANTKIFDVDEDDEDDEIIPQTFEDICKITTVDPSSEKAPTAKSHRIARARKVSASEGESSQNAAATSTGLPKYIFPPFSLLEAAKASHETPLSIEKDPIALKLYQTLKNFNVTTTVSNVSRGPRITRYELVPDTGVRIKAISNLVDEISMSLATAGIRIEAPIPGKAAVGVEVPNSNPSTVRLRPLLDSQAFKEAPSKTTVCLGADIAGDAVYADLAKMPHMLIAGATGMGKSVCINTIITSILYKARPDEVKLILIDPKKVELNVYSGIPHLLVPVVSDPNQAAGALSWAVNEMESRFDRIEAEGVRNIKGYNKAIENDPSKEPMCQIVIIIDELADLMMSSPDSVETSICRIAQKARAAGIHLIIGTQRPSVDVITGLIKANIPSRIAFHVSSQIDSRTILDTAGAEKLLNNGDMLFYPAGIPKPKRIQGAFVDDDEVERVVTFLKDNAKGLSYDNEVLEEIKKAAEKCAQSGKRKIDSDGDDSSIDGILDDPKFNAAIDVAFDSNKISTSLLQRKLSIGFGRAAKYIDVMCELGIVSEPDGQKPREILMTRSEYYERKNRHSE